MNSDIARRSHSVLTRALALDGPERDDFIAAQCADDPFLRSHVSRLLTAIDKSGVFLETPALRSDRSIGRLFPAPAPTQIGGYRIIRVLGAGGMATVYEAEQQQPRRTVALKVMRHALARTSAHQRFHFETEVLARLRHPGIAQIYEAGTFEESTGESLPYFAMEFIPGASTITDYARSQRLALRDVLRLFLEVCDAVQHGHQFGVIHRDIKPGNILVSNEATRRDGQAARGSDEVPVPAVRKANATATPFIASSLRRSVASPKIIDFGVARSVDPTQANITRDSGLGQIVGTLHYMSPEQCSESVDVDIRCDVYALGVVLYELIAGRLPHELNRVPLPEAIRIITHDSPPPLARFAPEARGDLEAIIAMAMEKEPHRRYASVAAFAADLRRYLADQPIDARPATTLTQIRKFARRNRALVAGVAAVFVTLVGGIAATTYMAMIADDARRAAETRERELEQVTAFQQAQLSQIDPRVMGQRLRNSLAQAIAETAGDAEAAQRARSEFEQLISEVNFTTLALHSLDENVLQRSLDAINSQFEAQPLVRARLLQRLALTMKELGLAQRALAVCEEALHVRRAMLGDDHLDTMESEHLRGSLLNTLGRYDDAITVLRDLLERSTRALGGESEKTLMAAATLGGALRQSGDLGGAEQIWLETLETQRRVLGADHQATLRTLNNIGIIHAMRGQLVQAEACWREVLERRRALGAGLADPGGPRTNLGLLLQEQGKLDEARPLLEEELAESRRRSGDDHPATLDAMLNFASLLLAAGELDAAEQLQRECLERGARVFGPQHRKTLQAMGALAAILRAAERPDEAEPLLRDALVVQRRKPGAGHPDTIESLLNLSELLCEQNRTAEAESLAAEALDHARRAFVGAHPLTADCLVTRGRALAAARRWDEAEAALFEAVEVGTQARGAEHPKTRAAREAIDTVCRARSTTGQP
jgi:serine/threonine protein kinase/tetratricopeptide (TPR) repeat protein